MYRATGWGLSGCRVIGWGAKRLVGEQVVVARVLGWGAGGCRLVGEKMVVERLVGEQVVVE